MKTKTISVFFFLLALAQGAWAERVTFNVRSWNAETQQVETTPTTLDIPVLKSSDVWEPLGSKDDSNDYYYLVKDKVSCTTLNCFGKVHLILADNAKLTCTGGIIVQESNNDTKLFIYSQSDGNEEGKLIVTNSYSRAAGIGSTHGEDNGTIEIHGGNLDIEGGKYAAGIGAGCCLETSGYSYAGTVIIYGGVVRAKGGQQGAGIGGGATVREASGSRAYDWYCDGAVFKLYGGEVTAIGGSYAPGVGGGAGVEYDNGYSRGGGSGNCYIYGGKLTAEGSAGGAGIGTACTEYGSTDTGVILISGGTVNATGSKYGAGIGGGRYGNAGRITITGGTVTAIGGVYGAGIGGGDYGSGGIVNISGGYVRAEGRSYGAGIGGGEEDTGGDVTITGGTVIAIAGEDCKAREGGGGSAIGCGQGKDDKDDESNAGHLTFGDNMRVTGGDAENNIERVFTNGERDPACRWRNYVKIEPCSHETPTVGSDQEKAIYYTIDDDDYHTKYCRYCKFSLHEEHSGLKCECGKSFYVKCTVYKAGTEKDHYELDFTNFVGAGLDFYPPSSTIVPEGYLFKGWEMNPNPDDGNKWEAIAGKDIKEPGKPVKVLKNQGDTEFYPRFLYDYVDEWTWSDNGPSCSVKLTCAALPTTTYSSEQNDELTISKLEDLTDEQGNVYGKCYKATLTLEKNGYEYKFTSSHDVINKLTLYDGRDNEDALYDARDVTMQQVVISGRTLWKDGSWNTLFLPFNLATLDGTPLEGATLMKLKGASLSGGTLNLDFEGGYTGFQAGTPYLVKWDKPTSYVAYDGRNADVCSDIVNPTFQYVTIEASVKDFTYRLGDGKFVSFVGTYKPFSIEADDRSVLYLGDDNMLYYPTKAMTIGSLRAFFKLIGLKAGEDSTSESQGIKAFNLNFGEETGIREISESSEYSENSENSDYYYSLDGRRIGDKPVTKGIYIHNGQKVMIK